MALTVACSPRLPITGPAGNHCYAGMDTILSQATAGAATKGFTAASMSWVCFEALRIKPAAKAPKAASKPIAWATKHDTHAEAERDLRPMPTENKQPERVDANPVARWSATSFVAQSAGHYICR